MTQVYNFISGPKNAIILTVYLLYMLFFVNMDQTDSIHGYLKKNVAIVVVE